MVKSIYECAVSGGVTTTANITSFNHMTGLPSDQTTSSESKSQDTVRVAGTLSNLYVNINTNSIGGTSTITFRKNGVDGNLNVSIGASATGEFEDLTHTDSIVSGDLICWKFIPGDTLNTMAINTHSVILDNNKSSTITSTPLGCTSSNGATSMTGAATTYFAPLLGQLLSTAAITTESAMQQQFKKTGTLRNFAAKVITNSRTTTTTSKVRKNTADGNQAVTIGSAATGYFEDTTHTDSIAINDLLNYTIVNGAADTSAISYSALYSVFDNTDYPGAVIFMEGGTNTSNTVNSGTTYRVSPFGSSFFSTNTEASARTKIRNPYTLSNYVVNITNNSIGASSTFTVVNNAVSTAITATIGSSATGIITDTTHTVSLASGDALSNQLVTGGFTGTMLVQVLALFATTNVPLQSYSVSETTTVISESIKRKAIPKITTIANSISSSLNKKTVPTTLTNTITISTTILRKAIPKITTQVISTSDSIARVKIMFRVISESISISDILKKKVIPIINAASISLSQSIKKVAIKTSMTESSSISNTLKLTVIRRLSESIVSNTTIKKFAVKTIQETAITVSASPSLKNIKKLTESSISISSSILKMYKAMRSISENYSIHSDSIALKIVRKILSSSVSVSSILVNVRIVSRLLSDTISAVTSSTVLKVIRKLSENITVLPSSLLKKIFTNITQSTTISNTLSLKTVKKPSNIISASDLMSQHLNAKRTFIESISHSETFTATHIYRRSMSEPSITATDGASVASKRMKNRNIVEIIPVIATVNRKAWFYRSTVDDTIIHFKDKLDSTYINFRIKRLFNFGSRLKKI